MGKRDTVSVPFDIFSIIGQAYSNIKSSEQYQKDTEAPKKGDIITAFTLYFIFLVNMDWENSWSVNIKLLLEKHLYRDDKNKRFHTNITRCLEILKDAELIDVELKKYTLKSTLNVKIKNYDIGKCKPVPCACIKLINLYPLHKNGKYNLLAVYCFLNIKQMPIPAALHKYGTSRPVARISQDTIARELGFSKQTIIKSIETLVKDGYVVKRWDGTLRTDGLRECNAYELHNPQNPLDAEKVDRLSKSKIESSWRLRHNQIKDILDNPEHTPCLLIGRYAADFKSIIMSSAARNKYKDAALIRDITDDKHMESLIESYRGLVSVGYPDREFICFNISDDCEETGKVQNLLIYFLDITKLKVIITADTDDWIIQPLLSRMINVLKKSANRYRFSENKLTIHQAYQRFKAMEMSDGVSAYDIAAESCSDLMILEATKNEQNRNELIEIDSLISKLSAKRFDEILTAQENCIMKTPELTRHLSLALMREQPEEYIIDITADKLLKRL